MDNLIDIEYLPPLVQELIEVMGLPEAIKLLEARGGLPTYVPERPERSGVLSRIVSDVALCALCGRFGRETLDLPKMDGITQQLRNRQIVSAKGQVSGYDLAQQHGLSYRHVKRIWQKAKACDDRQADMFIDSWPASVESK